MRSSTSKSMVQTWPTTRASISRRTGSAKANMTASTLSNTKTEKGRFRSLPHIHTAVVSLHSGRVRLGFAPFAKRFTETVVTGLTSLRSSLVCIVYSPESKIFCSVRVLNSQRVIVESIQPEVFFLIECMISRVSFLIDGVTLLVRASDCYRRISPRQTTP